MNDTEALAWIRKKLGLPEDAQMTTGQDTICGRLHVWDSHQHGYNAYITAYKCNDKQGEIARLTAALHEARTAADECSRYHQPRIAELERINLEAQHRIADLCVVIGDIEQCRCCEGDDITILCDDPEADDIEKQSAVELSGDPTAYERQRFYGRTWGEALHKAANAARRHYSE